MLGRERALSRGQTRANITRVLDAELERPHIRWRRGCTAGRRSGAVALDGKRDDSRSRTLREEGKIFL